MKKNFYIIGILLSIFLVYFMLMLADRRVYLNDDTVYDFMLDKEISFEEIKEIAVEENVTLQVRNYVSVEFGNNNIEIVVFDSSTVSETIRKNSLFPNDKIMMVYNPNHLEENDKTMSIVIQSEDESEVERVAEAFEKRGYDTDMIVTDIGFRLDMLFSSLNAQFFLLMFVLVCLCIAMYYMSRTKEIGILKMNGWSNQAISVHMLKRMLGYSVIGFLPFLIFWPQLWERFLFACSTVLMQ